MKKLNMGFHHTYVWAVNFHKGGADLGLYHKKDHALLAEIFICNAWVQFVLLHLPGGWGLWNKILLWTATKEERVLTVPATLEMLAALAPEEEWLWNPDYVETED